MQVNYANCSCNMCGVRMYHQNPRSRDKFCSVECERIDRIQLKPRKKGEEMTLDHVSKSKARTAFDAARWPVQSGTLDIVRSIRNSQSSRTLRIRGIKRLRITTKKVQNI